MGMITVTGTNGRTYTVDETALQGGGDGSVGSTDPNATEVTAQSILSQVMGDNSAEASALRAKVTDAEADGNISAEEMVGITEAMNQYASKMKLTIKIKEIQQSIRSGAIDAIRY